MFKCNPVVNVDIIFGHDSTVDVVLQRCNIFITPKCNGVECMSARCYAQGITPRGVDAQLPGGLDIVDTVGRRHDPVLVEDAATTGEVAIHLHQRQ